MTDKPKPLTKAEWETISAGGLGWVDGRTWERIDATIAALFRYRERTRGMFDPGRRNGDADDTDQIASEEGIE